MMKFWQNIGLKAAAAAGAVLIASPLAAMIQQEANYPDVAGYINLTMLHSHDGFAMVQQMAEGIEVADQGLTAGEAGFWVLEGKIGMVLTTENGEAAEFFNALTAQIAEKKADDARVVEFEGGVPGIVGSADGLMPDGRTAYIGIALLDDDTLFAGVDFESEENISLASLLPPDAFSEIMGSLNADDPAMMLLVDFKHPSYLTNEKTLPFSKGFVMVKPTENDFTVNAIIECADTESADQMEVQLNELLNTPEVAQLIGVDRDGDDFTVELKSGNAACMIFMMQGLEVESTLEQ